MKKAIYSILMVLIIGVLAMGCGDKETKEDPPDADQSPPIVETEDKPLADEKEDQEDDKGEIGAKLSKAYSEMMKNKKYLMTYKMKFDIEGEETVGTITAAISGDNTAMISTVKGMETSLISKADTSYIINHQEKTILEVPIDMEMEATEVEEIEVNGMNYVGTGQEHGLVYEEYTSEDGNIKYYFDGDKLVKMLFEVDGGSQEMEIIEMTDKVPKDIFDLPADYELMKMPGS